MLIAVLAVGIALFSFNACTDAQAQIGGISAQPERWEYKVLELNISSRGDGTLTYFCATSGTGGLLVNPKLNSLGAEGWQLVSVAREQHNPAWFTFKRRLR